MTFESVQPQLGNLLPELRLPEQMGDRSFDVLFSRLVKQRVSI